MAASMAAKALKQWQRINNGSSGNGQQWQLSNNGSWRASAHQTGSEKKAIRQQSMAKAVAAAE